MGSRPKERVMHKCSRCEENHGEGEFLDEQFLCNGCLAVLLVDAQIDADREEEDKRSRKCRYCKGDENAVACECV